ncbi:MAG: GGDEF domain-containing protein [Gammaproteobacteria bacterium]|nr:GGDEF domain-containing protein [Gammaproteobacteria bacterium]
MISSKLPREISLEGSLALRQNTFLKIFAVLLNLYLVPLTYYWFSHDNLVLATAQLLFLFSYNLMFCYALLNKPSPISFHLIIVTLGLALVLAVYYIGPLPILWTYQVLVAIYFLTPLRMANLCNTLIVLPISLMLFINHELAMTLRYLGSTVATMILGNAIVLTIHSLQQQLLTHSITDPLTGAFNRRHMDLILGQKIQQNDRNQVTSAILLIDIDFFKKINDQHGHDIGDLVLQQLVNTLFIHVRKTDTIFRLGGEDFLILLDHTNSKQALIIAENLRKTLAQMNVNQGEQQITVSVGVAELSPGMSSAQWLKLADSCLYRAKKQGRNKVIAASRDNFIAIK